MSFASLLSNASKVVIPGGQTEGYTQPNDSDSEFETEPEGPVKLLGSEYAEKYVIDEEEQYLAMERNLAGSSQSQDKIQNMSQSKKDGRMQEIDETVSTLGTMPNLSQLRLADTVNPEFDNFALRPGEFSTLPVFQYQDQLMKLMKANPVLVIKGKTGCGKSTQVPLMILDNYRKVGQFCNIIVTQPRRIAAISVTNTVCNAYNLKVGSLVGYQIGLDKETTPQTRLTYCTTGVLLQKLVLAKSLHEYTHIILDEVHERTQDMDFVMLLVKKLQRTNSMHVKIILMSATIDVEKYAKYFSRVVNGVREAAPVVEIKKESEHEVNIYYAGDLESKLGRFPESEEGDLNIHPDAYKYVIKLIKAFDQIDSAEKHEKGCVLIFLPGIFEIESMYEALTAAASGSEEYLWCICPLHSTITADEQLKVFQRPPRNSRKVILSTNIAESSITINDIRYVIDFCLTKTMQLDEVSNLSTLRLCDASKSMLEQRAGRAGRVMNGRVYRLISEDYFKNNLENDSKPEMLNSSLERTVLKAKQLDMGEPKRILALAMDPPDLSNLMKTILKLKEIGALFMTVGGKYNEEDGDLTAMGNVMAALPLDVHMSKLILLGHIFNVLKDAIVMACSMSVKSMFSRPFKKDVKAYNSKLMWADSSCSDPIACCNAYETWRNHTVSGRFNTKSGAQTAWAKRFFIQLNAMREVARLQEEVTRRLTDFGIEETASHDQEWSQMKTTLCKVILAGACYPNYFMRGDRNGRTSEREAVKLLGNKDPCSTVYLSKFPLDQPGPLYANAIRKLFDQCGLPMRNVKVSFDKSSRVYVEFKTEGLSYDYNDMEDIPNFSNKIPGKIAMAVYRALKMKQGKIPLEIPLLPVHEANRRMNEARQRKKTTSEPMQPILPSVDDEYINLEITHVNDISNFYAQQKNHHTWLSLVAFNNILNGQAPLRRAVNVVENGIYAAPYSEDGPNDVSLYRCKILSLDKRQVKLVYIDFGNITKMSVTDIYELPIRSTFKKENGEMLTLNLKEEPPLAFCCRMAHIQATSGENLGSTQTATQLFSKMCLDQPNIGHIYSVIDDIVCLEILIHDRRNKKKRFSDEQSEYLNVNNFLVERQLAVFVEESYLSKTNHQYRVNHKLKDSYANVDTEELVENALSLQDLYENDLDLVSPYRDECRSTVILRGPFSPLEMKLRGCMRTSVNKNIFIEMDSINSILLDEKPEDPHERMLVAAHVGKSASGDRLNLRYTTLLPNIQGLPAFICLLFSPTVELRTDKKVSKLTGALCGLGYNPETKKSYFPENDFEIVFDKVFSLKQIELINKLRALLSICLAPYHDNLYRNVEIALHQANILDLLKKSFSLLGNQPMERPEFFSSPYKWGRIDESLHMNPGEMSIPLIYNLIAGIQIDESLVDTEDVRNIFQKNINEMLKIRDGLKPLKNSIKCELCQIDIDNIQSLRFHFQTFQHEQLSKRFQLQNQNPET